MSPAEAHPGDRQLLDHWLGDTDAATAEAVDAHLLQCDACGEAFDRIVALARGVRAALRHGRVPGVLSAALVDRLKADGLHVREYRVDAGGSVVCGLAPQDELLVSRIRAPLAGVHRLDALFEYSFAPGEVHRLEDLPFDPAAGELVLTHKVAEVRSRPTHELRLRLLAVDDAGERELARYTFHHQAGGAPG